MKKYFFLTIFILFSLLYAFPIKNYDYHLPNTNISPYSSGLGGINLTNAENNLAMYDNPALLSDVKGMTFCTSFCIPDKNQSFASIIRTNPLIRKSVFRALGIQAQRFGFLYNELANDHFNKSDSLYKTYQDYKLRSIGISFADTTGQIVSWGISLKYLDGRVIYLKERKLDSLLIRDEFVDSKSMGFASDLGIYGKRSGFYYGFVVHDIFSKLYWKNNPTIKIPTRGSFSAELRGTSVSYISSVTCLWNIHETPVYTQSLNYSAVLGNPATAQSLSFRFGATSQDYKKSENILFGYGTSYMIQTFKIDLSMQTQGMKTSTAQYLFSVSIGE